MLLPFLSCHHTVVHSHALSRSKLATSTLEGAMDGLQDHRYKQPCKAVRVATNWEFEHVAFEAGRVRSIDGPSARDM